MLEELFKASSAAVYGETLTTPTKETEALKPLSPYAIDKCTQELFAQNFSDIYDMNMVSLRFFNVYGEKQDPNSAYAGVIPIFINRIKENQSLQIYGDGKAVRDFIYVEDIAKGIYQSSKATSLSEGHTILNIGSGEPTTINELALKLLKASNKNLCIDYLSQRQGEIKDSLANVDLAKSLVDFSCSFTLEEGLKKMLLEGSNEG